MDGVVMMLRRGGGEGSALRRGQWSGGSRRGNYCGGRTDDDDLIHPRMGKGGGQGQIPRGIRHHRRNCGGDQIGGEWMDEEWATAAEGGDGE